MKKVLVLLPFLACGPVFAEQTADFDRTMQDVAEDLSALHWKLQAIYESQIPSGYPSSSVAAAHLLDAFKKAGIVVITADSAEIYKGAALNAGIVESVPAGKQFPVLDKVADWYAVALDEPVTRFLYWLGAGRQSGSVLGYQHGGGCNFAYGSCRVTIDDRALVFSDSCLGE